MTTFMNPMRKPKEGITEWGNEKVCLYNAKFISDVWDYFMDIERYMNDNNIELGPVVLTYMDNDGIFDTYVKIARKIGSNINVHDDIIQIDGTHEAFSEDETRGEYTSITEKFKDWKHLTMMVDKAINEFIEYIGQSTKYTNSTNFMQSPMSTFKIQADIERMKKLYCVTRKRGELNMSLKYERNAAELYGIGGRRRRRSRRNRNRNRKNKNRKSRRR